MIVELLLPREADLIFRYPAGRTLRLILAGRIPAIHLPDGEIRIDRSTIEEIVLPRNIPERGLGRQERPRETPAENVHFSVAKDRTGANGDA
jgi:hypothetical protein